jgi:NADP-dependent 3-hydroxy acid dehydrogenase YdfG
MVTDMHAVDLAASNTMKAFGRVDFIVNNEGPPRGRIGTRWSMCHRRRGGWCWT